QATANEPDPNPTNNLAFANVLVHGIVDYIVTNANDNGAGSLRQAILDANAHAGLDLIAFNIPGSGVHTINSTSEMLEITKPVILDGYTQAGASINTRMDSDNAMLRIQLGVSLGIPGATTIRGLVLDGEILL